MDRENLAGKKPTQIPSLTFANVSLSQQTLILQMLFRHWWGIDLINDNRNSHLHFPCFASISTSLTAMKLFQSVWLLASPVFADVPFSGALNGFPVNPYDPFCAMSCLRSLSSLMLSCSSMGDMVGMMMMTTQPACWAENTPYLTSLAWCMHTKCAEFDIPSSKFELFWETQATGQGNAGVQSVPAKWSYSEALANTPKPPKIQLSPVDEWLNDTSIVSPLIYQKQWNILTGVQRETKLENTYG